ncbi:SCAN domain-containing protein 3 [Thelohanellus kitauei]|uniref:SCAN domain-containing protein 3 n=1 Tax=Thelohanellus kitauei TaxID=669202 RepID=A0A0C2IPJ2_THEKT|nr:SCAN domain-containing protein 3 [Thelohanellus kitauei]
MFSVSGLHSFNTPNLQLNFTKLPGRTKSEELFCVINSIYEDSRLPSTQFVVVCTDGASVSTGSKSGLVTRVKQEATHIVSTLCMIHREAIAAKNINENLADALSTFI